MQRDGMSIGGSSSSMGALQAFVVDSNDALKFRLIRGEEDLDSEVELDFEPAMSHQIYGENENIFGYRNLKVDMYMTASTLKAFIRMKSDEVISMKMSGDVKPDPVIPPLLEILAPDQAIVDNIDEFRKYVNSDKEIKFVPFGEKIDSFESEKDCTTHKYEVYLSDESVPGFRDFHSRLQPWIMFFIDAASYIDIDDNNWRFFCLFEKYTDSDGRPRYAIAGYITVFQYYAYPENMRPRISQMLVLPPFQRQGLGAKLLHAVSKHYWSIPKVVDITVEDPSEDFVRLRDFVDVSNGLKLVSTFADPAIVKAGFSEDMVKEANEKLKLCRRQARRVYEIIRLHWTKKACPLTNSPSSTEYKAYRMDVKNRLNAPFRKEEKQLTKLQKVLSPDEFAAATANITHREQRLAVLDNQFKELEEHYLQVLERIASA